MLRLFTTLYLERNPARQAEYEECLRRNLACAEIDEICVLAEGDGLALSPSLKIRARRISRRPHYADYFAWIEELARPDDVSIIANSDIFFDAQIGLFKVWMLPERTAFALSRWDLALDGRASLFDRNDSQDSWIFRGRASRIQGDFPVGVPRCDNRILFELQAAEFQVLNPSFSIRSYHLHKGLRAEYAGAVLPHFVAPPYRYIWPHNFFGPVRTLWHNLVHPRCRVHYRWDQRRFRRWLPVRIVCRLFRMTKIVRSDRNARPSIH